MWTALTLGFVGLTPAQGSAQSRVAEVELTWAREARAESCADQSTLESAVVRRLGRDPFGTPGALLVEGHAYRDGARYRARLALRGPSGELLGVRAFESDATSCESLLQATGLAIALAVDENTSSGLESMRAVPGAAPAPQLREAQEQRATQGAARGFVDARASLGYGLLPGLAPGLALGSELSLHPRLNLNVELHYFPERELRTMNARFAFGLTAGSLGLCVETLRDVRVGLALCASAQLGAIHATVFDVRPLTPGDRFWAGAVIKAQLYVPLGALRISLAALGTVPITRERFLAAGADDPIFRQKPVAVGGELGLGVRFL